MTPKEKAKDLFQNFWNNDGVYNLENTKETAIICANEILKIVSTLEDSYWQPNTLEFWEEVKQEIDKL